MVSTMVLSLWPNSFMAKLSFMAVALVLSHGLPGSLDSARRTFKSSSC